MPEKLHCTACNYKFIPKNVIPKACPYCGKLGTLIRSKDMQDWINEVDEDVKELE